MPTYTETDFEDHIKAHLNQSDYRSLQSSHYSKSLCLIPSETLRFIQMNCKTIEKIKGIIPQGNKIVNSAYT